MINDVKRKTFLFEKMWRINKLGGERKEGRVSREKVAGEHEKVFGFDKLLISGGKFIDFLEKSYV
jgi:hypothetical protein